MDKQAYRKKYLEKRLNLNETIIENASYNAFKYIINHKHFIENKYIYLYYPIKNEINTIELINYCLKNGKKVFLPKIIDNENMEFFKINSLKELKEGKFNLKQPLENKNKRYKGLMIIPFIACYKNYRIGYGKGYYDRYLKNKKHITIGIGYKFQKIRKNIFDKNDIKLDEIKLF